VDGFDITSFDITSIVVKHSQHIPRLSVIDSF